MITRFLQTSSSLVLLLPLLGPAACAAPQPPSQLTRYVGPQTAADEPLPDQRPLRAGLVLVYDRSGPEAGADFPDQALVQMAEALRHELSQYPLMIERVMPPAPDRIQPGSDPRQWMTPGQRPGLDYLMVVVASATEQEYPLHLPVGGTTHVVPGLRRDNWSLAEAALLDARTGRALVTAEGRGWATLDRPTTPDINQWYPVIWKRPLDPNWRWWPPTYESAPYTLRVIAMREAVKRLVVNFQDAWLQKRDLDTSRQAASR